MSQPYIKRASNIFHALFIIIMIFFSVSSYSQNQPASLEGNVVDSTDNSTISSAKLELLSVSDPAKSYKTNSDILGKFSFNNIDPGTYKLNVKRLGYKPAVVNNINVQAGNKHITQITLEPSNIQVDKINVTATKTELTLKQTPSTISILTSDDIKNRNLLTFDNALERIAGVTVFRTSGINVQSLSIRGSSDVAGGGIGNRVLLLLDGRPSLTGDSKGALWSLIPISIIERTEVVKGAFSSLYGSSAIGGVVNVITKKPTYNAFTGINLNYGFYERLPDNLKFTDKMLSFKGVDISHSNTYKKLAYLLNFNYKQNDGHAQQTDYEFYSGLAKFMYDVFNNRDLEVTVQYTRSNSAFPHYWRKDPGSIAQPYEVNPGYIGDRIKKETQSYDLFYTALPSSKTKYTSRFYYYKLNSLSYYNPNNFVSIQYAPPGEALETTIKSYNFGNISQFDIRLGKKNYLITGTDIQWNVVRSNPESILYGDQQVNNFGIFAQDQYNIINDRSGNSILSSTAGVRYDYVSFVGGNKFVQVSPKLSFLYSPNTSSPVFENTSFRILGGRAFRAPSIAELYFKKELFGGFDFVFNPNLKPEDMNSLEIGFRKQYKKRFTLDLAAYINEYKNMIQYVNIGGNINGPFQVQNIANAQIKGIEVSIDYTSDFKISEKPFKYSFSVNYNLVDARDLSKNRLNDDLPYKPVHNLNLTTDLSFAGFNFNVSGKYLSKVEEDLFYKYEEPQSYFLVDMKLSKKLFEKATVFVAVNNLMNISYQELERTQAPNRSFNSGVKIEF